MSEVHNIFLDVSVSRHRISLCALGNASGERAVHKFRVGPQRGRVHAPLMETLAHGLLLYQTAAAAHRDRAAERSKVHLDAHTHSVVGST